mgnify:FL=1
MFLFRNLYIFFDMEKLRKAYEIAVVVVLEVTELDREKLFKSLLEEYVDARAILINWLVSVGYTERMIAEYSGMSQQRINFLKNTFIYRKQRMSVGLCAQEINKRLTNCLQTSC